MIDGKDRNVMLQKFWNNKWVLILLAGVLLMVLALPTNTTQKNESITNLNSDTETQLEDLLGRIKYVGDVKVMITYKEDETVEGIVVLATGANNAVVVREITEVVQALFNVESHNIKVKEHAQNN
jgi:stage III sporulation protein AG